MSSLRRFSHMSLTSRATHGIDEQTNYEDMTDEELKERLELIIRTNEVLSLENDIFERYLNRNDSQLLVPMAQVLETAKTMSTQMSQISSTQFRVSESISGFSMREKSTPLSPHSGGSIRTYTGSRGAQVSIIQPSTRGLRIALSQRIGMVNKEIDELRKEVEERERQTIKKQANFRVQIEEMQMRIRDINEASKELEERVVERGIDKSTGKIHGEKFIRYIEMWLKNADRIIDKLRLKSSTIKSQIRKARIQLQQREELDESLHLIDFQALEIENKVYSKEIDEKTKQLMELKKVAGQYSFALSNHKNILNKRQMTLNNVKKRINMKRNQIEKLNCDLKNCELQLQRMEQRTNKISKSTESQEIRDLTEVIKAQSELQEMKKTYARLDRHESIQLMALKAIKKHQQLIDQIKPEATTSK